VQDGARIEIDHLHAAPRLRIGLGQFAVQLQALEALIARLGQADKDRPTKAYLPWKASPRTKPGQKASTWNFASAAEAPRSIQPSSPVPELRTHSRPR
jgi:hypothetical protein